MTFQISAAKLKEALLSLFDYTILRQTYFFLNIVLFFTRIFLRYYQYVGMLLTDLNEAANVLATRLSNQMTS